MNIFLHLIVALPDTKRDTAQPFLDPLSNRLRVFSGLELEGCASCPLQIMPVQTLTPLSLKRTKSLALKDIMILSRRM